jgi:hypothetical protein
VLEEWDLAVLELSVLILWSRSLDLGAVGMGLSVSLALELFVLEQSVLLALE